MLISGPYLVNVMAIDLHIRLLINYHLKTNYKHSFLRIGKHVDLTLEVEHLEPNLGGKEFIPKWHSLNAINK